jgi:sensor histidine kinase YesM
MLLYMISVVGMAIIFQHYLRNYYYENLMRTQSSMEESILDSAQDMIALQIEEYINAGAMMATSSEINAAILDYIEEDDYFNKVRLQTLLNSYARNTKKLYAMAVLDKDGLVFQNTTYHISGSTLWVDEDKEYLKSQYERVVERAASNQVPRVIVSKNKTASKAERSKDVFHIFFPMIGTGHGIHDIGHVLCLSFSSDILQQYIDYINSSHIEYLIGFITDENGKIICHTNDDYLGVDEQSYVEKNNLKAKTSEIPAAGWKLSVAYDEVAMKQYINSVFRKALPLYGIVMLILSFVIFIDIRNIMRPIRKIKRTMYYIAHNGKHIPIDIEGTNEIWRLATAYNNMLVALEQKEKEVEINHRQAVESIERQHEAERNALETQINAHFICNTLNTINYEAIEEGNHKVSVLIKKLSNILRYSFDQKSQNVFFYQEFAWIEQYLYLMKARLEDTFEYDIKVDDNVMEWPCCKLMLQPFVENAIIHGFEGMESGGMLTITGRKGTDCIEVMIKDNGKGMSSDVADRIEQILNSREVDTEGMGIGIQNAFARMKLYYGDGIKVKLVTEPGKGTEFRFELPIPEGKLH